MSAIVALTKELTKQELLNQSRSNISECTLCNCYTKGKCPGYGNINCDIMVIGEAPADTEIEKQEPFTGKAGKLWDKILDSEGVKLDRNRFYITNAVKCWHRAKDTPSKNEIDNCQHILVTEIEAIQPKIIILMGNTALYAGCNIKGIMSKCGEIVETKWNYPAIPIIHPSSCFYGTTEQIRIKKLKIWKAWQTVSKMVK